MYSWKGAKGYCVRASDDGLPDGLAVRTDGLPASLPLGHNWELQPTPTTPGFTHLSDVYCIDTMELWVATYYWMIMLISGASGGDTDRGLMYMGEHIVFLGLVIAACLVNSQIIASFCDVLANLNPEESAFNQRMDHLNRYCRASRFDKATRRRLREFLIRAKHVQMEESQKELVMLMSPKIQGELSLKVNGAWLSNIDFLRDIEAACCVEIALSLDACVFVPSELLSSSYLYHMQQGTVVYKGKVVVGDSIFGRECIVERDDLRSRQARALSYIEVTRIHRERLLEIVYQCSTTADEQFTFFTYPKARRKVKWAAVRLGMINLLKKMGDPHGEDQGTSAWARAMNNMSEDVSTMESLKAAEEEQAREAAIKQASQGNLLLAGTGALAAGTGALAARTGAFAAGTGALAAGTGAIAAGEHWSRARTQVRAAGALGGLPPVGLQSESM